MGNVKFIFTNEIEVYFFLSYRFIDDKGNLIPLDELKKFRDRIIGDTPKLVREIRFDNKKAYYSFFDSFCTEENMPLVISIAPNEVNIINNARVMNGEVTESDILPSDMQIRLSKYGAATIRVLFKLPPDKAKAFDDDFLYLILKSLKEEQAPRYANAVWQNFCEIWNKNSEYRLPDELKQIDIYLVLFLSGIKVIYGDKEIKLTDLKKDDVNIQQNILKYIEKMLVGLAISSYLWPKYSNDFVQKFIRSDLSTTENEFQFIAWRNALIYFEGEETGYPTKYREYLYDMLLGLELLFIMRSTLQLLDVTIDKKISQGLIYSGINPLKLIKFKEYNNILEYFDRWILLLTGWRRIHRYAMISHFHDFLRFGLEAMRVEIWLATISNKISLLRDTIKVQSDRVSTINLVILTLILVVLTIFLILK